MHSLLKPLRQQPVLLWSPEALLGHSPITTPTGPAGPAASLAPQCGPWSFPPSPAPPPVPRCLASQVASRVALRQRLCDGKRVHSPVCGDLSLLNAIDAAASSLSWGTSQCPPRPGAQSGALRVRAPRAVPAASGCSEPCPPCLSAQSGARRARVLRAVPATSGRSERCLPFCKWSGLSRNDQLDLS